MLYLFLNFEHMQMNIFLIVNFEHVFVSLAQDKVKGNLSAH